MTLLLMSVVILLQSVINKVLLTNYLMLLKGGTHNSYICAGYKLLIEKNKN